MPKLYAVGPDDLARVWDAVAGPIASAIDTDSQYHLSDIKDGIGKGAMQLWLGMEGETITAVAVTQIQEFPQLRLCDLFVIAGQAIEASVPLLAGIEAWARDRGCAEMRGCGRDGWKQHLPAGWSAFATLYRKTL